MLHVSTYNSLVQEPYFVYLLSVFKMSTGAAGSPPVRPQVSERPDVPAYMAGLLLLPILPDKTFAFTGGQNFCLYCQKKEQGLPEPDRVRVGQALLLRLYRKYCPFSMFS